MKASSHRRPPLVFVVDDDPLASELIQNVLLQSGYEVACASNVAGALSGIRQHHPDLVLLDVNLPDGSGLDVCRQLQKESGTLRTPVLFISANEELASKVQGFEAGGVDYIPKPFACEEVLARVSTHLRLKQAFESLAQLQAEQIRSLVVAQEAIMPLPEDLPEARFSISLQQVLEAGGDFYDVMPIGREVVDYIVADASGHDFGATFWTAALKTLLPEYATPAHSPLQVVCSLSGALRRVLPEGVYFTAIYARLNRQTHKLTLVNAGHPPAIVVRAASGKIDLIRQQGDVVGAFEDASFGVVEFKLCPGDRLFLYSDGLIEGTGSREEGLQQLLAAFCDHRGASLQDMTHRALQQTLAGRSSQDDVLLMGIEA